MVLVFVDNGEEKSDYCLTLDEAVELIRKHKTEGVNPCNLYEKINPIHEKYKKYAEHPESLDRETKAYLEFFIEFCKDCRSRGKRSKKDTPYLATSATEAGFIDRLPELSNGKEVRAPVFEKARVFWLRNPFINEIDNEPTEGLSYEGYTSDVKCFGKRETLHPLNILIIGLYVEYLTEPFKGEKGWFPVSSMFRYLPLR